MSIDAINSFRVPNTLRDMMEGISKSNQQAVDNAMSNVKEKQKQNDSEIAQEIGKIGIASLDIIG